jgi:hypothetical protein
MSNKVVKPGTVKAKRPTHPNLGRKIYFLGRGVSSVGRLALRQQIDDQCVIDRIEPRQTAYSNQDGLNSK